MTEHLVEQLCDLSRLGRARQRAKIGEIIEALRAAGFTSLDDQAKAIGLGRSTTWSMLKGLHKNSGLSATTVVRMLGHNKLPAPVRRKVLEYVHEKMRGLYGDGPVRVSRFKRRLASLERPFTELASPQVEAFSKRYLKRARFSEDEPLRASLRNRKF